MYYIYSLIDTLTDEICYIGFSRDPYRRLHDHIDIGWGCDVSSPYKSIWIDSLKQRGYKPILNIIDSDIDINSAKEKEFYWIWKFRELGHPLLNLSPRIKYSIYIEKLQSSNWAKERGINISEEYDNYLNEVIEVH